MIKHARPGRCLKYSNWGSSEMYYVSTSPYSPALLDVFGRRQRGVVRENEDRVLQPGNYVIECGGVDTKATRTLTLKGQPILVERSSEWLKAGASL